MRRFPVWIFCLLSMCSVLCVFAGCSHSGETDTDADVPVIADPSAGNVIPVLEKQAGHSAEILGLYNCFLLQFPKSYILDNTISCLSVSETAWHTKDHPYLTVSYDLLFDSTGSLHRILSSDQAFMKEDITSALIDYVDTFDLKPYDTVRYNSKKQIVKTCFGAYQNYYTYDSAGRLCEHAFMTPPAANPPFHLTAFSYDAMGKLVKAVIKDGKLRAGVSDNALYTHIVCWYTYVKERLTSIRYSFKNGEVSYSTDMKLVYDGPILSKITMFNPKEAEGFTVTFRVCKTK